MCASVRERGRQQQQKVGQCVGQPEHTGVVTEGGREGWGRGGGGCTPLWEWAGHWLCAVAGEMLAGLLHQLTSATGPYKHTRTAHWKHSITVSLGSCTEPRAAANPRASVPLIHVKGRPAFYTSDWTQKASQMIGDTLSWAHTSSQYRKQILSSAQPGTCWCRVTLRINEWKSHITKPHISLKKKEKAGLFGITSHS